MLSLGKPPCQGTISRFTSYLSKDLKMVSDLKPWIQVLVQ